MESVEEVEAAVIERVPLWNDRTNEHGPFDIIGDVHGCADELEQLLTTSVMPWCRHEMAIRSGASTVYQHPQGARRSSLATSWIVGHGFSIACESFATWFSTGAAFASPAITT